MENCIWGILEDTRLATGHIALLFAVLFIQSQKDKRLSRKKIMHYSKIKSIATYHRYINDLKRIGYITYMPSYDPRRKTFIKICKPQKQNN